jgi:uncharacterized membrane protein (TIGR02234 family)
MAGTDPARRELAATVLAVLLGAGGVLLISGRTWVAVSIPRQLPFSPVRAGVTGRQLYPALSGLAVVGVIVAVLVLVTGSRTRRLLGAVLVLTAAATGWYSLRGATPPPAGRLQELLSARLSQQSGALVLDRHPVWPWLSVLGSAVLLMAGVALVLRGGGWGSGLSGKYAAPAEAAQAPDPWRQLDRGEDPTVTGS